MGTLKLKDFARPETLGPEMRPVSVNITKLQHDFIKSKKINFSALIRELITELISQDAQNKKDGEK